MSKQIETIADLTPAPRNANQGTPRGRGMIEQSVRKRGAGRSGLAAKDGTMIAGSQTLDVMSELGIPVRTIHTTGEEWVVVVRDDLEPDSEEAELLGIEDNRSSELGLSWSPDILSSIADSGVDLSSLFTADEWADVAMPALPDAGADEPVVIDETQPTRCQAGDIWRIGRHTVACLDSTDRASVERLIAGRTPKMVWADPPYGMQFQSNHRTATPKFDHIKGDDHPLVEFIPLIVGIPVWYICCRWDSAPVFMDAIAESGHTIVNWIVWHKSRGSMGDLEAAYRPTHETILYCSKDRALFTVDGRDDDTWDIDTDAPSMYDHPTQKPIALPMRAIRNHTRAGDIIFDPFLGSGPSLKAAEPSGRTVIGCELSPHYIDHLLEWGEAEGLEVARING